MTEDRQERIDNEVMRRDWKRSIYEQCDEEDRKAIEEDSEY